MALNIGVTDSKAELDGAWVTFPLVTDIEVKIARFMNPHHENVLKKLRKPYTDYKRQPSDEQANKILIESISEAVLLDWKGVKEDDKDVKYSKDEAIRILSMPEARDFLDFIVQASSDLNTYRKERIEESGKP